MKQKAWSAEKTDTLRQIAGSQDTDCLMIVEGGRTVFTYGDVTRKYLCHSIRKSILAALMGMEVRSGKIDLGATLADLGIDDHEGLTKVERAATVYDLLTARSGVYHQAGYETEWMRMIKEPRHSHAPGTFWCYNNWDFNTLGTIFVQASGQSVAQAFVERIAEPLCMEDFSLAGPTPDAWTESFESSLHDAYPFRLSSRDLARFGQLFLDGGTFQGKQILPQGWAAENVMPYSHAGPSGAYGYMWWLERDGVMFPSVRMPTGSYGAFGAGGHYCMVVPQHQLVVIHRVDTDTPGKNVSKHGFGRIMAAVLAARAAG